MTDSQPQLKPPAGELRTFAQLVVRHPRYDDFNILLKLPALNKDDTIEYSTALTICGIISDNSWTSGWFARSRNGEQVCGSARPIKAGEVWYFTTANPDFRYPVCPTWDE